jgi:para-nitrobenzyl esterase
MGDFDRPQSEDCLTLSITTPAVDGKRRPVILWLHGGAFWTGAGSLDWYDGASLTRHGDVVVVGVNYRLGALGFMHLPGVSPPNLGLLDQFAALRWVAENIEAFGGDPDNITVMGQSAGGLSILAMLTHPDMRRLMRRAIIQSAPFGRMLRTRAEAQAIGEALQRELRIEHASQWLEVDAQSINVAQLKVARSMAAFGSTTPAFIPVSDHDLLGDDVFGSALAGATEVDVMVGWTRDEMAAFFAADPSMASPDEAAVAGLFRRHFGAASEGAMAEYRQRSRDASSASMLAEMLSDASFASGALQFAERLAALGRPAWTYRFDWSPPGNRFGACHCGELPFVFDTLAAWQAPMLDGGDPQVMNGLAAQMRDSWIAFARDGNPNHSGIPAWPPHDTATAITMCFDADSRAVPDLPGRRRWVHWP